jgi:hypothetical protein
MNGWRIDGKMDGLTDVRMDVWLCGRMERFNRDRKR